MTDAEITEIINERDRLRAIVETHDLCHDLHGKVGPREFADGCAAEQRKLYGCAPDADEVRRLRALVADLSSRLADCSGVLSRVAERQAGCPCGVLAEGLRKIQQPDDAGFPGPEHDTGFPVW